jgi:LAGLIDADG DNA endonuclease family protein
VSISPRPTLSVGWEVRPSLSVSQNGDRSQVLLEIQRYFECGTIRPDRSDQTLEWEIRSLPRILQRVVPHFEAYPLLSKKRLDAELFAEICRRMATGEHRKAEGLERIVRLAVRMNPSGRRTYKRDIGNECSR